VLKELKKLINDKRIISAKSKWYESQKKAQTVAEYVNNLINHLNKVNSIISLRHDIPEKGEIFRIGITHLTENKIITPVHFTDRTKLDKMFLEEFMVLPIGKTTLGKLIDSGKGDVIQNMKEHFESRPKSISAQMALKLGVESNVRMPYKTVKQKGIIFFSADVVDFFSDLLVNYIESIIPDIEAYLNITEDFDNLVKSREALAKEEGDIYSSTNLMQKLKMALETKEEYPFKDKILIKQEIFSSGKHLTGNLANIWELDENRMAFLLIESEVFQVDSAKMSLYLRGMFCKEAAAIDKPKDVMQKLESHFWDFLDIDPSMASTEENASIFYGIFDFNDRTLQYTNAGFLQPVVCRKEADNPLFLNNSGLFFGSMDREFTDNSAAFTSGDKFVFATTSLTELANKEGKSFGDDTMKSVIKDSKYQDVYKTCQVIYDAAEKYSEDLIKRDAILVGIEIL